MVEIALEEFEEFYKSKLNEIFYKERRVANKILSNIREQMVNIKVCLDHFMEAEEKLDQKAIRSLNFFSDKIRKEINEIEVPDEEITYSNLMKLQSSLKKLFNNINDIARKSLPKFKSEVQSEIKELNYITRNLSKEGAALDKFVRKKYNDVKEAEDVLEKLPKFFTLYENIENAKNGIDRLENEQENIQSKLDDLNKNLLELEKHEFFKERKKARDEMFQLKLAINNQLGFKKALKKLRVEMEKNNIYVSNVNENYIRNFIKNPIKILTSEDKDLTKFRGLLVQLRHILEENKLNLKSDKKEKTIEQINIIFDERTIYEDIEKYKALRTRIQTLKKKIKAGGFDKKLEDLQNDISIFTQKLEHNKNDLERRNKDYLRYLATLKKEREDFQKIVKDVIEEDLKLTITFSF